MSTPTPARSPRAGQAASFGQRSPGAYLRIILGYTDAYTATAREATKSKLKMGWAPTNADTSHADLKSSGGRNYVSNAYGMQRKDWAA